MVIPGPASIQGELIDALTGDKSDTGWYEQCDKPLKNLAKLIVQSKLDSYIYHAYV